ncbi:hypothetical protein [Synechococcus sp. MIT S1220]|uniref:hypothetical protein n=1 Tax=Synechococcus sp. MIT S1220 TaxID=3082549 RepID=UPI0039AFACE9
MPVPWRSATLLIAATCCLFRRRTGKSFSELHSQKMDRCAASGVDAEQLVLTLLQLRGWRMIAQNWCWH